MPASNGGVRVERPDLALVQDAEDRVGEKGDAPPAQSRHERLAQHAHGGLAL
jgi:hypothetical protein